MTRNFAVGIDLHGTLLDENWQVPDRLAEDLHTALRAIHPACELFLCTGNDLTFVHEHLGRDLSGLFDGFVLETGCVVSRGAEEEVLVPRERISLLREVEHHLRDQALPGVRYFARRLATISLFTKTELGGPDPAGLYPQVLREIEGMGYAEEVMVTHSDVAVDIIPSGFNKYTGLRQASEAPSLIGIADSLNDLHLIANADRAFLPANASPALLTELSEGGRQVKPLEECGRPSSGTIAIAEFHHTEAVIEILKFLRYHLQ